MTYLLNSKKSPEIINSTKHDNIMTEYEEMSSILEKNDDEMYVFLNKNCNDLLCDGCGKPLGNQFCIIPKNTDSNPLNRAVIVHMLGSSTRCRIRKCSGCNTICVDQEKSTCPKCDTILPRNVFEEI